MSLVGDARNSTIVDDNIVHYKQCIIPLLKALQWTGTQREYTEALPHFSSIKTPVRFCDVMGKLGFTHVKIKNIALSDLDERIYPALFVAEENIPHIILESKKGMIRAFNGENGKIVSITNLQTIGDLYRFKLKDKFQSKIEDKKQTHWFYEVIQNYHSLIFQALFLSLVFNLFGLTIPFYVMSIYDKVIGASSLDMLRDFFIGMMVVICALGGIHYLRARILGYLAAQIDRDVGNALFSKLLHLHAHYTESASVESQISRIKDFDSVRGFFTGSMLTNCFDLPFITLFIFAMYLIGGPIIYIPIILVFVYALMTYVFMKLIGPHATASSYHATKRQEFLLESMNDMLAIKQAAGQRTWINRHRDFSANASNSTMELTFLTQVNSTIVDFVMMLGALSVMVMGVLRVFDGLLSVGALVASMIILWRILGPIKQFFLTIPRMKQVISSINQIDRLIKIPSEVQKGDYSFAGNYHFSGAVRFNHVSFKYPNAKNPSLLGVDISLQAGQILMIVGKNGAGKSTLLKLLFNLYQPQAGSITIDNHDIRQLNAVMLRQALDYSPQHPQLFYGTITQNIRLADPTASLDRIVNAAKAIGLHKEIMALPQQYDTTIRDNSGNQLPASFQQKISLARALVKDSGILLLDEPANHLDQTSDECFLKTLASFKGKKTVIMITHRPSHLKLADHVIAMDAGQIVLQGKPKDIMDKLMKGFL